MSIIQETLNKVLQYVKQKQLILPSDNILISISGGSDSTALAVILYELKDRLGIKNLGCAHFNHRLRGTESDRDENFCKLLAEKLELPFYLGFLEEKSPKGESAQAYYREKRYKFLQKVSNENNYNKIATGHTIDDNVETILMRLLSGTGSSGLTGINPIINNIIRPINLISRKQLEKILEEKDQNYVFDSSNLDDKYLRNSLRLNIIPEIAKIFPSYKNAVTRFSEIIKEEDSYFNEIVKDKFSNYVLEKENRTTIPYTLFNPKELPIYKRLIKYCTEKMGVMLSHKNISDITDIIQNRNQGTKKILDKDNIQIYSEYGDLVFIIGQSSNKNIQDRTLIRNEKTKWGLFTLELKEFTKSEFENEYSPSTNYDAILYFDKNSIIPPISVRNPNPGDRILLSKRSNGKKIKELLIDKKIPQNFRKFVAVIADRDKIIGIISPPGKSGYLLRSDATTYISNSTANVVCIEITFTS